MAHLRSPTLLIDEITMLLLDLKLFSPLKHGVYKKQLTQIKMFIKILILIILQ